jgi:hypothetical protein
MDTANIRENLAIYRNEQRDKDYCGSLLPAAPIILFFVSSNAVDCRKRTEDGTARWEKRKNKF